MNYSLFYYKKDWEIFHFLVIKDINMQHELILIDKTVIQIFKHNMLQTNEIKCLLEIFVFDEIKFAYFDTQEVPAKHVDISQFGEILICSIILYNSMIVHIFQWNVAEYITPSNFGNFPKKNHCIVTVVYISIDWNTNGKFSNIFCIFPLHCVQFHVLYFMQQENRCALEIFDSCQLIYCVL